MSDVAKQKNLIGQMKNPTWHSVRSAYSAFSSVRFRSSGKVSNFILIFDRLIISDFTFD